MPAVWRLATSSLSGRRSRAALLIGAVALSAALIACVCCAMASIHKAIEADVSQTVGAADVRIRPAATTARVPEALLELAKGWTGVSEVRGRLTGNVSISLHKQHLAKSDTGFVRKDITLQSTAQGFNVDPVQSTSNPRNLNPPPQLLAGRLPTAEDEIAIDALLAYRLSYEYQSQAKKRDGVIGASTSEYPARATQEQASVPERASNPEAAKRINSTQRVHLGDTIEITKQSFPGLTLPALRSTATTKLKVVGIAAQPPLGGRSRCYLTLSTLSSLTGQGGLSEVVIALNPDVKPDHFVDTYKSTLPAGVLLQTTERITSGLQKNMQSNQLGMILATVMAFLSASFIILTGLTTNIAERQRELAMVRCIGGTRAQLGRSQLVIGLILGLLGAAAGIPLGIGIAGLLAIVFREELSTGFVIPWWGAALALVGSLLSGVIGAAWPAWRASRVSPLEALASRAAIPRPRGVRILAAAAILCLAYQFSIVGLPRNPQFIFWAYATSGLPIMFIGYFLLGVPACLLVTRLAAAPLSRLLVLPPRLLSRTVQATPYRHGLTAGALMAGLALMVGIWTDSTAVLRDWIDKIKFPDAFVSGVLSEGDQKILEGMTDTVAKTAAITLHPVEVDAFGVRAIQKYKTMFVGFEPRAFMDMVQLSWVQGDPETAIRRLEAGNSIIVAREFLAAQGLGVGGTFTCTQDGVKHDFEIVGVVASPGLEIASKFFNVGEDLTDQSIHAVFGSRNDLKDKFFGGQPAPIHLIQVQFTPQAIAGGDEPALEKIRQEMIKSGSGFLDAGSGVQLKAQIRVFAKGAILVFSCIALISMLVACFGVANIIVAGIDARQFEFGVLRAVGAQPGLLSRLIAAEALLIAFTACMLGTSMGIQGSWAGQRLNRMLLGLDLNLKPPPLPILASCLVVILLTLAAAMPAIVRLNRKRPRELLGSTKG